MAMRLCWIIGNQIYKRQFLERFSSNIFRNIVIFSEFLKNNFNIISQLLEDIALCSFLHSIRPTKV
jgi:hypothetical protein